MDRSSCGPAFCKSCQVSCVVSLSVVKYSTDLYPYNIRTLQLVLKLGAHAHKQVYRHDSLVRRDPYYCVVICVATLATCRARSGSAISSCCCRCRTASWWWASKACRSSGCLRPACRSGQSSSAASSRCVRACTLQLVAACEQWEVKSGFYRMGSCECRWAVFSSRSMACHHSGCEYSLILSELLVHLLRIRRWALNEYVQYFSIGHTSAFYVYTILTCACIDVSSDCERFYSSTSRHIRHPFLPASPRKFASLTICTCTLSLYFLKVLFEITFK